MSVRQVHQTAVSAAKIALGLVALALPSCIERGYPLSGSGQVDIFVEETRPLFAADTLDANGNPVLPRQSPYQTAVSLYMTEGSEPAFGAYVEVRLQPSNTLVLRPANDQDQFGPSCGFHEGAFRCTASSQGYAKFIVASEGDWSGDATIIVAWADRQQQHPISVIPAGLPSDATNFTLAVDGDSTRILATYVPLQCTIGPVPDDLGSNWREGEIRSRTAHVVVTPPSNAPTVVEHAPVIVELLHGDAALSLKSDCAERLPRLRMLLDANGISPAFNLCFSDRGGEVEFAVSSGQKIIDPNPSMTVDPEPRLLRIRTLISTAILGSPADLFEISAYNADRVRIAVPVDVRIGDDQVIALTQASLTLNSEVNEATLLQGTAVGLGTTQLYVTPRLLSSPECSSEPITVVDAPP